MMALLELMTPKHYQILRLSLMSSEDNETDLGVSCYYILVIVLTRSVCVQFSFHCTPFTISKHTETVYVYV